MIYSNWSSWETMCRFSRDEMKRIYRGFKTECPTGVLRYIKSWKMKNYKFERRILWCWLSLLAAGVKCCLKYYQLITLWCWWWLLLYQLLYFQRVRSIRSDLTNIFAARKDFIISTPVFSHGAKIFITVSLYTIIDKKSLRIDVFVSIFQTLLHSLRSNLS